VVRGLSSPPKGREESPMNLTRLAHHQHPRPPHHELRQKEVLDSASRGIGQVDNLYVDDDGNLQFADVSTTGLFDFGKKHYLIPVEVIAEEDSGTITLRVDQQTVQSAPPLGDPHAAPDEGLQRAAREHCGLAAVPPPEP
jgi:sporulation protein YlmC with PRC-barrel domain